MPAPRIFAGLNCHCGEHHYQGAAYYVSVTETGRADRTILAVGPFAEHFEALAHVAAVNRIVCERYNPEGRADWYGYGTTAMHPGYNRPGKINAEVL